MVFWLDILGTAVFAISGVLLAGKLRMDPFGVLVLGVVTAVAAGRSVIWRSPTARYSG
ncbi:Predicted membrane protein [Serratia fonticola]|uniref:Predicted membrane protein n=1 Tax=Serratia fonticola TaxID=47917 RepID=A0A4U9VCN7_SERFO|nr:Predicted membrane protein [Serratia fonticola]